MSEISNASQVAEAGSQPTKYEQLRVIPWSLGYDLANTFFVQLTFFGTVFILFLNDLGLNESQIGLLISTLPFLSLLSLFITGPVARWGYRRTFLVSMALRNLVTAGLLLVPLLMLRLGVRGVITYVAAVTIAFAVSRAAAMTAFLPWQQEYIPPDVRGRISGYSSIIISLAGLVAVAIAGFLLDRPLGVWRYPLLFGIGMFFGMLSLFMSSHFPGGGAHPAQTPLLRIDRKVLQPLRDSRFLRYLAVLGLVTLAIGPILSFLPIFMKERVGLDDGSIVLLQTGSLIGSLLSSYFWGWLADRYGSKPISMTGLFMMGALPVLWFLMPRGSPLSFPVALGISFFQGIASSGWSIGSGRLLFVSIVSGDAKTEYLSQYNAWTGLLSGLGSILGGALLHSFSAFRASVFSVPIDSYGILFALGVLIVGICAALLYSLHTAREAGLREFAGLFLHGNALMAIGSMIRFYYAKEEADVVAATQRLANARSPLTVEELIGLLNDPRFYVRFEAIVSIARHSADNRLLDALAEVLRAPDPALSTMAAWALARFGSARTRPALRQALETSPYRSVQIHASRALASMGDRSILPWLKANLESSDWGVRIAAASGLGKLKALDATPGLLRLLHDAPAQSRKEAGLSLARLLDAEVRYIQVTRSLDEDAATTLAREMESLRSRRRPAIANRQELAGRLAEARDHFARGAWQAGFEPLRSATDQFAGASIPQVYRQILVECAARMQEFGRDRPEYIVIALVVLERCSK